MKFLFFLNYLFYFFWYTFRIIIFFTLLDQLFKWYAFNFTFFSQIRIVFVALQYFRNFCVVQFHHIEKSYLLIGFSLLQQLEFNFLIPLLNTFVRKKLLILTCGFHLTEFSRKLVSTTFDSILQHTELIFFVLIYYPFNVSFSKLICDSVLYFNLAKTCLFISSSFSHNTCKL